MKQIKIELTPSEQYRFNKLKVKEQDMFLMGKFITEFKRQMPWGTKAECYRQMNEWLVSLGFYPKRNSSLIYKYWEKDFSYVLQPEFSQYNS